jgi:hypothetical protein
MAAVESPLTHKALLGLHQAVSFADLWPALQRLFEALVPHDTLVMSLNYIDWRQEASPLRLTSANSRVVEDKYATKVVAKEGRKFFGKFLEQNAGIPCYRHSQIISDRRAILATPYYQRYMVPGGWRYSAHLLFWRGKEVETSIALRRRGDQGDFTDAEMATLHVLHAHIAAAFDRTRSFEEERRRRNLLEQYYRSKPEAVLFLDWGLNVLYASQEAIALCVAWNLGPDEARSFTPKAVFSLPPEIIAECVRLKPFWERRTTGVAELADQPLTAHVRSRSQPGSRPRSPCGGEQRRDEQAAVRHPTAAVGPARRRPGRGDASPRQPDSGRARARRPRLLRPEQQGHRRAPKRTEGSIKVQLSGVFRKLRVNSRAKLIVALR